MCSLFFHFCVLQGKQAVNSKRAVVRPGLSQTGIALYLVSVQRQEKRCCREQKNYGSALTSLQSTLQKKIKGQISWLAQMISPAPCPPALVSGWALAKGALCPLMSWGVHCAKWFACGSESCCLTVAHSQAHRHFKHTGNLDDAALGSQRRRRELILWLFQKAEGQFLTTLPCFWGLTSASWKTADASTSNRIVYLFLSLGSCLMKRLLLSAPSVRLPIVLEHKKTSVHFHGPELATADKTTEWREQWLAEHCCCTGKVTGSFANCSGLSGGVVPVGLWCTAMSPSHTLGVLVNRDQHGWIPGCTGGSVVWLCERACGRKLPLTKVVSLC